MPSIASFFLSYASQQITYLFVICITYFDTKTTSCEVFLSAIMILPTRFCVISCIVCLFEDCIEQIENMLEKEI